MVVTTVVAVGGNSVAGGRDLLTAAGTDWGLEVVSLDS